MNRFSQSDMEESLAPDIRDDLAEKSLTQFQNQMIAMKLAEDDVIISLAKIRHDLAKTILTLEGMASKLEKVGNNISVKALRASVDSLQREITFLLEIENIFGRQA